MPSASRRSSPRHRLGRRAVEVLPDIVGPEPRVVFCGLAGAESTRTRDHYYASPGNNFWAMLHQSGLTPRQLEPAEEAQVVEHGLGLSLLPAWAVRDEVGAGKLAQLRIKGHRLRRSVAMVSLGRFQPSPTRAFLAYILDHKDKLQEMARAG